MNDKTTLYSDNMINNNSGGTILINSGGALTIKRGERFNNNAQSTLTINSGGTINNLNPTEDTRFKVSTNSTYNNSGTLNGPPPLIVS